MSDSISIKVAAAVPATVSFDPVGNAEKLCSLIRRAAAGGAKVIVFPRHCIEGGDASALLGQKAFMDKVEKAQIKVLDFALSQGIIVHIPGCCGNFSAETDREAMQSLSQLPIVILSSETPDTMFSAFERDSAAKSESKRRGACVVVCTPCPSHSNAGGVFDGSAGIYFNGTQLACSPAFPDGDVLICADVPFADGDCDNGIPYAAASVVPHNEPHPFIPRDKAYLDRAFRLQATALAGRLESIGCRKVVIGVSGGLDSTLALLASVICFDRKGWDRKGIIGISMPGFGTSRRTRSNSSLLMEKLGISMREISIAEACRGHLADIGHDGITQDTAYENAQARERTQILFDVANMEGAIVIGTGDLSEITLGWCTYNGDHMSNFGLNCTIPKTLVRAMTSYAAEKYFPGPTGDILRDIVDTPVSPELKGGSGEIEQKTEDTVGPYELHDYFLYNFIKQGVAPSLLAREAFDAFGGKYSRQEVKKWLEVFLKRLFSQQFKRSCSPEGALVGPISLDPRTGWTVPSDVKASVWLDELKNFE